MNRTLTACAALLLALTTGFAGAADPFAGIRFTDGKTRSITDLGDQTVVMVYFCGHCPSAGQFMRTQAKAVHDLIQTRKVPMHLVCVTPDLTAEDLVAWTRTNGMEHALVGQDTLNPTRVGLNNILQQRRYRAGESIPARGSGTFTEDITAYLDRGTVGSFHYPVDGLTDEKSRTLWWMVERDQPQAMETLMAARRNKAMKEDAEKIYAVVEACLGKRQDDLLAAEASMATYEGLEILLTRAKPVVLKPAAERLKQLSKDPTIRNEVKARAIYHQCQDMITDPNPQKQQAGREGLAVLAKKYGDTMYGKKAAGG